MKIREVTCMPLSIPFDRVCVGGVPAKPLCFKTVNPTIVQITTHEGLSAYGYTIGYNDNFVASLKAAINDVASLIIGDELFSAEDTWDKLWYATLQMGHKGFGICALAALDSALWNLRAKAVGMPLANLLGSNKTEVPVYANHLLWRDWSIDELQKDAAQLVKQGFRYMKMNMGSRSISEEVMRIRAVREAVGQNIEIMIDANWAWDTATALRISRKIEEYRVFWLEDPLASNDPYQTAEIARLVDVPIAAGETYCGKYEFRTLLEAKVADFPQIDLQNAGGVTEWMKVAAMAQAWNLPVSSHAFHDFSVHLIAAVPNGLIVEYLPWWEQIYQEPLEIVNGYARIPNKPGVGLELDPKTLKQYELK